MNFNKLIKPTAAELIGTLVLSLVVLLSINNPSFPVPTPVLAGLTLGLFVFTIGPISGTHINPAVTIALWSLKKISTAKALMYIFAQFLGASLATFLAGAFIINPVNIVANTNITTGFAELIGTMLFTFGIAAVVHRKADQTTSSLVIGLSLLLGISLASIGSNGVLNPAVAYAISSFSLPYILGPALGAIAGMWGFQWLSQK